MLPTSSADVVTQPIVTEHAIESRYPEILAELDRLQNKKSGWVGAIVIVLLILGYLGLR